MDTNTKIVAGVIVSTILAVGILQLNPDEYYIDLSDVEQAQEVFKAQHGTYLQILPGNTIPDRFHGAKLEKQVPDNMEIVAYETPSGEVGYQVLYANSEGSFSVGYGPEATERTWAHVAGAASSTPIER